MLVLLDIIGPVLIAILSLFNEGKAPTVGGNVPWESSAFVSVVASGDVDRARAEFESELRAVLGKAAVSMAEKLFPAVAAGAFLEAVLSSDGKPEVLLEKWVGSGLIRRVGVRAQLAPEFTRVLALQRIEASDRVALLEERDRLRRSVKEQIEAEQRLKGRSIP